MKLDDSFQNASVACFVVLLAFFVALLCLRRLAEPPCYVSLAAAADATLLLWMSRLACQWTCVCHDLNFKCVVSVCVCLVCLCLRVCLCVCLYVCFPPSWLLSVLFTGNTQTFLPIAPFPPRHPSNTGTDFAVTSAHSRTWLAFCHQLCVISFCSSM